MEVSKVAQKITKGNGSWLILLHGLQSCKNLYDDFIKHPHFKDYSILALDFIGFGDSEKPKDFSYDLRDQMEAVVSAIEEQGIRTFTLICHSFSGTVGTLMLEKYPDKISAIVSMEGNLVLEDSKHAYLAADMTFENASAFYKKGRDEMQTDTQGSGALRYAWTQNTPDFVFYKTAKSIVEHTKSDRLLKIFETAPQPKLLILGKNGSYVSRPKSDSVQITTIPQAGHFMILDNPEDTFEAIHLFLKKIG